MVAQPGVAVVITIYSRKTRSNRKTMITTHAKVERVDASADDVRIYAREHGADVEFIIHMAPEELGYLESVMRGQMPLELAPTTRDPRRPSRHGKRRERPAAPLGDAVDEPPEPNPEAAPALDRFLIRDAAGHYAREVRRSKEQPHPNGVPGLYITAAEARYWWSSVLAAGESLHDTTGAMLKVKPALPPSGPETEARIQANIRGELAREVREAKTRRTANRRIDRALADPTRAGAFREEDVADLRAIAKGFMHREQAVEKAV